jgi:putative restriction endonuclease
MRTSTHLTVGEVYTRADLRKAFGITDQTLNNGVFKPSGHDSVWLFITEEKAAGMTDYRDQLAGNTLAWQGQAAGRTDSLISDHVRKGLEIIVFYRKRKNQYPGGGFRYEGRFAYRSHSGSQPTSFLLDRVPEQE